MTDGVNDGSDMKVVTVSMVNMYLRMRMERDVKLNDLYVKGEISNFTDHQKTGHFYFTLKDETSLIKAVMFRSFAQKVQFTPENGMKIIVRGRVAVFERDGIYQIYVSEMVPDGIGALHLAFEQLKIRLNAEGLFSQEHKRPIPKYPQRVGVVTSPTGAAIQDIRNVISRRFRLADIILYPAIVQGDACPQSVCDGINYFNENKVDVIIIGRGGGSLEDLWGFNDETLARTIYASGIPVISAVGHETDFSISDFVADLRVPTPSAAAERCVPDTDSVIYALDKMTMDLAKNLEGKIEGYRSKLGLLSGRPCFSNGEFLIAGIRNKFISIMSRPVFSSNTFLTDKYSGRLKMCESKLYYTVSATKNRANERFSRSVSKLDALSPLKVFSRGYSAVRGGNGEIIKDVGTLKGGDKIQVTFSNGTAEATVEKVAIKEHKKNE